MNFLRAAVSGKRYRLKDGDYDLDLTYITDRLIAMGLPAFGMEGMYRNDGTEVSRFLREKHRDAAWICNLSERLYDKELFDNRVSELGFPDHHSPPLEIALGNLYATESWLRAGEANVVVVHCLAGKGRTGAILGGFLAMIGTFAFEPVRPVPGKSLSDSWCDATGEFHDVFRELLPPHVESDEPDADGSSDATGLRTPAGASRARWVLSPQRPGGYGRAGLLSLVTPSAMKQSKRLTLAAQMAAEGFIDDEGEVEDEESKGQGVEMGPVAASGSSGAAHSAEPMARWRLAHPHRAACMSLRAFHVRRGEGVTYAAQTRTVTQIAFAARACMRRAAMQELPPGQVHLCGHPPEEDGGGGAGAGAGASHCGSPRLARGGDVPCLEIDATPAQLEAVRARATRLFRSTPLAAPARKVRLLAVEIALCPRVTSGRLHPYLTIRSTPHQREGRQGRVFYNSAWDCAGRRLGSYSPPERALFDADSGDAWRGVLMGRRAAAGAGIRPRGSSSSSLSRASDASGFTPDGMQEARARARSATAGTGTAAAEVLRRCDDHASPMRKASFVFRLGGPGGGGAGARDAGAWEQGAGCVVDGDVTVRLVHQPGPEGALEPGGIVAAEPQELCRWTLHTNLMHTERSFSHASPADGSVQRRTVYRLGDVDMEGRKGSINAFHPAFRADVVWQYEDEQEQRLEEEARGERESEAQAAGGALAAAIGGGKAAKVAPGDASGGEHEESASGGEHEASAPVAEEASDQAASSMDQAASATFVDIGDEDEEGEGDGEHAGAARDGGKDKHEGKAETGGADSSGKTDGKVVGASSRAPVERSGTSHAVLAAAEEGEVEEGAPAKARSDALRVAAAGHARAQEQDAARKEEAKRVAGRSAAAAAAGAADRAAGADGTPPDKGSGSSVASSQAARPPTQSYGPPSRQPLPLPRARAPLVARGGLAAAHGVLETLTEGSIAELLQGTGPMPRGGGPAGGLAHGAGVEGVAPDDRSEMGPERGKGDGQGGSKGRRGLLPSAGKWVPRHWVLRRCVLYSYRSPLDAVPWEGLPLSDVVGLGRAPASVVGYGRIGIQLTLRSAAGSGPLGTAGFFGGERQLVLRCPAVRRGETGDSVADFERWFVALVTAHAAVTALRHRPGAKQGRSGR